MRLEATWHRLGAFDRRAIKTDKHRARYGTPRCSERLVTPFFNIYFDCKHFVRGTAR